VSSVLLFALCLVFFSFARMGLIYLGAALALNACFCGRRYRDGAARSRSVAWEIFRFSIYYLGLLVTAAADVLF
jgi:heme O synthase-like polyprenyltransferase